jgi:hypothetical protein
VGVEAFGIGKEFLKDLLAQVDKGSVQLPEFQRGWVWPDRNIASLIASISLGYPAGTIMTLKYGGEVRFKTRPVEGAVAPEAYPERLILDGQQRLTSLYQSLYRQEPVETQDIRGKEVRGWFYLDMVQAVGDDGDREQAVVFVPEDRVQRNFRGEPVLDLSTPDKEYAARMFPCHALLNSMQWMMGFWERGGGNAMELWKKFHPAVVQRFEQYQLPVIELGQETPRQAVCQVFEKVNTGGVTLTVFELLTATFAADEFDLRADWEARKTTWEDSKYRVLGEVSNTDFLQAVTLLSTLERRNADFVAGKDEGTARRVGCRRTDMLGLPLTDYQRWAPAVTEGLKSTAQFLHGEHLFEPRFLPYGSQLIPLAAVLAVLGPDAEPIGAGQKIARWYWSGVFGELYGGTTETRFARDLPEVVAWVRGTGGEPRTVQEAQFTASRLRTLRTRGSAAYKGIYAMLLKRGACDWRTGSGMSVENYFDNAVDIHHVFPKAWCEQHGIKPSDYNSILNKTPLTAKTNRIIGGRAPSFYLKRLAGSADTTTDQITENVTTHLIDVALLVTDDYPGHIAARERELLGLIGAAMGKPAQSD